jgi:transcriptional regulator with XRE-family HTH domain
MVQEDRRFGPLLRSHRVKAGFTQEELAQQAGLGVRTVSDLERGRTTRPYRHSVWMLAEALGLSGHARDEFVRLSRAGAEPAGAEQAGAEQAGPAGAPAAPVLATQAAELGLPVVPRQLPPAVRHFAGREGEMKLLSALVDEASRQHAVVISAIGGTAGVGNPNPGANT